MAFQNPTPEDYGFSLRKEEHKKRFNRLKNRPWEPTAYLDFNMLDGELRNVIQQRGQKINWANLLHLREPTYQGLTLEFLSTLNVVIVSGPLFERLFWSFQLGNKSWDLTLEVINEIFGFPSVGNSTYANSLKTVRSEFNALWTEEIAVGGNGDSNRYTASRIREPSLKVLHKFMVHTIFGRGSGKNNITQKERIVFGAVLRGYPMNSAALMMSHLRRVAGRTTGRIAIGGLVTRIAKYLIPLKVSRINLNIIEPTPIAIGNMDAVVEDGGEEIEEEDENDYQENLPPGYQLV